MKKAIDLPSEVQILLQQRLHARQDKDWEAVDRLRQQIAALGWLVKDTREGQVIEELK